MTPIEGSPDLYLQSVKNSQQDQARQASQAGIPGILTPRPGLTNTMDRSHLHHGQALQSQWPGLQSQWPGLTVPRQGLTVSRPGPTVSKARPYSLNGQTPLPVPSTSTRYQYPPPGTSTLHHPTQVPTTHHARYLHHCTAARRRASTHMAALRMTVF